MLMDKFLMMSDDQAITATANCTTPLALSEVAKMDREAGGEPMEIVVQVTQTFVSGGSTTLAISLATGNNSSLGSPATQIAYLSIPKADLVAGKKYKLPFQMPLADADASYFGLVYTVTTGPFTAGKLTAWVQRANEDQNGLV